MSDRYTPDKQTVKNSYVMKSPGWAREDKDAEFERFYAAAKAEGLEEAARVVSSQAAEEWRNDRGEGTPHGISIIGAQMIAQSLDMVAKILLARSTQLKDRPS